jgi:hypothetical protein
MRIRLDGVCNDYTRRSFVGRFVVAFMSSDAPAIA